MRVFEDDLQVRAAAAARVKIEAARRAASCVSMTREERREAYLAYLNELMFELDDLLIRQGREWLESGTHDPLDFLDRR